MLAKGAEEEEALECGICCLPFDRCGRAPRRLGGARGSWKPSRCRHVLCSACVCRLAREGWWAEVVCPYCRAVTPLRERCHFLAGPARRRLVLPPIDAELWQRVVRREEGARAEDPHRDQEEPQPEDRREQSRLWRALKRLLKGADTPPAQPQPINPYAPEVKDLALMTCYVI